jgi:glycolate oxidase FAD binding subunit
MNATTLTIDGFGPLPVQCPRTIAELAAQIRDARVGKTALYPVGGQTQLSLGNAPTKSGQAVDLRGLAQVIDFPARDMTITVQAGITMECLREILLRENLRLPIDVAQAGQATLGGILAANLSGPRRFGYGTLRDYVIGISALNDEGEEFKAGGRVVKNVAGYDLCKLLVGSLGTLGIITTATLKLRPRVEEQALLCLACDASNLESLLASVHATRTRPVCIDLLNAAAGHVVFARAGLPTPTMPWTVLVGYEGNEDAVTWQVQQLVKEIGTQCRVDARVDFPAQPLWDALTEFGALPEYPVVFKATMVPSALPAFCLQAQGDAAIRAHAGNGIVYGQWPAGLTSEHAALMLTQWRERAHAGQGSVIVPRCPPAWKSALSVWGPAPNDAWLMREVKAKFDPNGIFNPGRFIDGI